MTDLPFIMGAQYYRAPTPGPEAWENDLKRLADLGGNSVKYWVQWRWSSREPGKYYFDDIDRLMDLAADNGLDVTLNVIFDVAPLWLYEKYPDAKQMRVDGTFIEPHGVPSRQIGGYPGPCFLHPGAREARMEYLQATLERFKDHPAMRMWDIWNEAKLGMPKGSVAGHDRLFCYCPHCCSAFIDWLREKYGNDLDCLNDVWGRCYGKWSEIEFPRNPSTLTDFVDYREFQIDTVADEARWRIDMVHKIAPDHTAYLHVVPSTGQAWDSVVCAADDFALAEPCDIFAATVTQQPFAMAEVMSAARGKTVYNVESHVNHGQIVRHQRELNLDRLKSELLPQIGVGIKGFMFWQFRSETLGTEAPGWGVVNPDGSDRAVTMAVDQYFKTLKPHADRLMACEPPEARVGIWKSRKNEIFHYAIHGRNGAVYDAVSFYCDALYDRHMPFRIVSGEMLAASDLDGLDVLIMPLPYYVSQAEADALADWVERGGTLLSEGNLAGYEATRGRHAGVTPGCGLAERFGFSQVLSMPPSELDIQLVGDDLEETNEDVRKAMEASRSSGGRFFPVTLADGSILWGVSYYGELEGEGLEALAAVEGRKPCVVRRNVGKGAVIYAATYAANAASEGAKGLEALVDMALDQIAPPLGLEVDRDAHADILYQDGKPAYVVVLNRGEDESVLRGEVQTPLRLRGVFNSDEFMWDGAFKQPLPGGFADLMEVVG